MKTHMKVNLAVGMILLFAGVVQAAGVTTRGLEGAMRTMTWDGQEAYGTGLIETERFADGSETLHVVLTPLEGEVNMPSGITWGCWSAAEDGSEWLLLPYAVFQFMPADPAKRANLKAAAGASECRRYTITTEQSGGDLKISLAD